MSRAQVDKNYTKLYRLSQKGLGKQWWEHTRTDDVLFACVLMLSVAATPLYMRLWSIEFELYDDLRRFLFSLDITWLIGFSLFYAVVTSILMDANLNMLFDKPPLGKRILRFIRLATPLVGYISLRSMKGSTNVGSVVKRGQTKGYIESGLQSLALKVFGTYRGEIVSIFLLYLISFLMLMGFTIMISGENYHVYSFFGVTFLIQCYCAYYIGHALEAMNRTDAISNRWVPAFRAVLIVLSFVPFPLVFALLLFMGFVAHTEEQAWTFLTVSDHRFLNSDSWKNFQSEARSTSPKRFFNKPEPSLMDQNEKGTKRIKISTIYTLLVFWIIPELFFVLWLVWPEVSGDGFTKLFAGYGALTVLALMSAFFITLKLVRKLDDRRSTYTILDMVIWFMWSVQVTWFGFMTYLFFYDSSTIVFFQISVVVVFLSFIQGMFFMSSDGGNSNYMSMIYVFSLWITWLVPVVMVVKFIGLPDLSFLQFLGLGFGIWLLKVSLAWRYLQWFLKPFHGFAWVKRGHWAHGLVFLAVVVPLSGMVVPLLVYARYCLVQAEVAEVRAFSVN